MHKNWRIDILLSCYSFQENHPTFRPHTLLFSGEIKCMYLNLLLFVGTRWDAPRTPLNKPWHKNKYLQERKEQLSPMMKELDPHIPVSVCITVADPGFSLGGANSQCGRANLLLPPANVVCEGYVFTGVCLSTGRGMRGCWGACMVAGGACMVAGGVCVVTGGVHGCQGVCMVGGGHAWLLGGHVWLLGGSMCGCGGHV